MVRLRDRVKVRIRFWVWVMDRVRVKIRVRVRVRVRFRVRVGFRVFLTFCSFYLVFVMACLMVVLFCGLVSPWLVKFSLVSIACLVS
jgi:hypothetical protein